MVSRSSIEIRRAVLAIVSVLATASASDLARAADPDSEEEALLRRGVALRREGRDAAALEVFQRALARGNTPRARAQIALAEQSLALWLLAERDLALALAEKDDPWIRQNRETLERGAQIVAGKLAWIAVSPSPPLRDAELLVNGTRPPAAADGRVRVVAGQVVIELRAAGHAPASRVVQVAPETTVKVAIEVGPALAPVAEAPRPPPPREGEPPSSGLRTTGWIVTGVGVAALGAGSYFGIQAFAKKDERDADCAAGCTQAGVDADQSGRTAALVSSIAMATGVAAASVGIWLVLRSPRAPSSSATSVTVRVRGASIVLGGTF